MSQGRTAAVAEDAAFLKWRGKVAGMMLVLFALSALPTIIAWLVGYVLPTRAQWLPLALLLLLLLAAGLAGFLWPQRVRVRLLLLVPYLASVQGLIWYSGDMARVWLLGTPILALILVGPRSAGVTALVSIGLIILHAAGAVTGITDDWRVPDFDESRPQVVVARSVMWMAFFLPLLFLIRKVHLFHQHSLAAERTTSARLEAAIVEQRTAHEALARAAAERERLERENVRVGDEERRRLGQDLHDGVSQQLAVALLRSTALERRLAKAYPEGLSDASDLSALLESTMDEVREVARSLSPTDMNPEELGPALGALARRATNNFGVRCEYWERGDVLLPDRKKTLDLYRIAQEAVNNAGEHARARQIAVTLAGDDGRVLLSVEDDGSGMPTSACGRGLGLRIMAFRAHRIGGTLAFEHPHKGGTRVVCEVPT